MLAYSATFPPDEEAGGVNVTVRDVRDTMTAGDDLAAVGKRPMLDVQHQEPAGTASS